MIPNILKICCGKGLKMSVYALKFIGGSDLNRLASNRSIIKLRSYQSKTEHQ
jgi:hypothetical protein